MTRILSLMCLLMPLVAANAGAACLDIERGSGFGSSTGQWVNRCTVGVHVKWKNFGTNQGGNCTDPTGCYGCESTSRSLYPCLAFVPANGRITATLWGVTNWHECRHDDPHEIVIVEPEYGLVKCVK